jgi:hypothetical protein
MKPFEYVGCYRDLANDKNLVQGPQAGMMDVTTCQRACQEGNYPFFALQRHSDNNPEFGFCTCDYDYGLPSDLYPQLADEECGELRDEVNNDLTNVRLGGPLANAIYQNREYVPQDYQWIGCYTDNGHRDFDFGP